jgi:hypothetical protein
MAECLLGGERAAAIATESQSIQSTNTLASAAANKRTHMMRKQVCILQAEFT